MLNEFNYIFIYFIIFAFHVSLSQFYIFKAQLIIKKGLTKMFSSMRRGLKSIDFYQAVPSQLSEGTVSGACISITLVTILFFLILITVIQHASPHIGSDLIIDHEHLDQKLKVNMDISFHKYPCSMLSLDVENILKVHQVNIGGNIHKYQLPSNEPFQESKNREERKNKMKQDFKSGKGCRMTGWFQIDRVPGNFHFSCHGYSDIITQFLNDGTYRQAHRHIDLTHTINYLWFGQTAGPDSYTLKNFQSQKQISQQYLGISYTYFLDIVQTNNYNPITQRSLDSYLYTVRMNQVILGSFPLVYFKYETNPITVFNYQQYKQWHELFVKMVGIIGGVVTIGIILDGMVHSSIRFLLQKHRLNKLR